jgi:hypothetical protein
MLVLLLASLLAAPPAALPPIGVASLTPGRSCVLIEGAAVPSGSPLTIVTPHTPQKVIEATITGPAPSCNPTHAQPTPDVDEQSSSPELARAYGVELKRADPDVADLGVAFIGRISARRLSGVYELRASDVYPRVRVRSCTSMEGVHLSVWSGTPRASRRLWHSYLYLGYDVEPTCEDDELERGTPQE